MEVPKDNQGLGFVRQNSTDLRKESLQVDAGLNRKHNP